VRLLSGSLWLRPRSGVLSIILPSLALGCAFGTERANHRLSEDIPVDDAGYGDSIVYPGVDSGVPVVDSGHADTGVFGPDVLGAEDHHVRSDAPVTCVLRLGTGIPSCDACLSSSCCAADDACGANPACLAFNDCVGMCAGAIPDAGGPRDAGPPEDGGPALDAGSSVAACMNACQLRFPVGSSLLAAVDSCMSTMCPTECGGP